MGLPVAVKTVLFSAGSDRQRKQALTEAAMAQSIAHPNVVSTYCVDAQPIAEMGTDAGGGSSSPGHPAASRTLVVR